MSMKEVELSPEVGILVESLSMYCEKEYGDQPLILALLESIKRGNPTPTDKEKDVIIEQMAGAYMIQHALGQLGTQNLDLHRRIQKLESDIQKLCVLIDVLCDERKIPRPQVAIN